jgi:hypothetical protein
MRTPKQIQASRANGARSKGPVTAKGKQNSSRNSIRHGLLAETVVLKEESTGRFFDLLNDLIAEHQPATPTEVMLVETIAVADWRRSRIWGMQKENFDHDVASCDVDTDSPALCAVLALRSSPESIRSHELLLRYEVAFDRQVSRALARLQQIQEKRAARKDLAPPIEDELPAPEPISPQSLTHAQEITTRAKRTQQPLEKAAPVHFVAAAKRTRLGEAEALVQPRERSIKA